MEAHVSVVSPEPNDTAHPRRAQEVLSTDYRVGRGARVLVKLDHKETMLQANQLSDWPIWRSYQCSIYNLVGAKDRAEQAAAHDSRLRSVKPLR
jgi:hypothetical protein